MSRSNSGIYEKIQHYANTAAKITTTCIRSSAYHWHYDYELLVVLKGKIEVLYGLYGPDPQIMKEGDVILINAKDIHGVRAMDLDNLCLCIQFSPTLFGELDDDMKYFFYLNSISTKYKTKIPCMQYVKSAAEMAISERTEAIDANMRKNAWLYMLLADILRGAPYEIRSSAVNTEQDAELVVAISSFIDKNLEEDNIANLICKHFGRSEKSLYILLNNMVGLSLKKMIDVARIEKACTLLQDTSIPIQVISDRCGYAGGATFYRRFKAEIGITPGDYRKGLKENSTGNEIQDYLSYDELGVDELLTKWSSSRGVV